MSFEFIWIKKVNAIYRFVVRRKWKFIWNSKKEERIIEIKLSHIKNIFINWFIWILNKNIQYRLSKYFCNNPIKFKKKCKRFIYLN